MRSQVVPKEVLPEVELRNGSRVRLQALFSTADGATGALLEPLPELGQEPTTDHGLAEILNVIEWLEEGVVLLGPTREIRALNSRFGQIIGLSPKSLQPSKRSMTLLGR